VNGIGEIGEEEKEALRKRLGELKREHRALEEELAALQPERGAEPLALSRIKKRKLLLKDRIARIKDRLYPDIIA